MTDPEFESILEAYPVRLQNFEGPLDLLLHLIRKHEVNIYDIPDRPDHAAVPRLPRADAGDEPGRGRRVPGDGGHADPHQVAHAAAAARSGAGRGRGGSARRADAPAARAPEVQGGGRAAARARDAAQRAVDARRRADCRDRRGSARAGNRSRSLQPDQRLPRRRRTRQAAAEDLPARRADPDRRSHRAAAGAGCRKPRRAASRTCSRTCSRGPG